MALNHFDGSPALCQIAALNIPHLDKIMGRWTGTAVLLLLAVLWGTMVPSIAHLLKTWDPLFLAALRYLGGGPALLPVLLLMRGGGQAVRPVALSRVLFLGSVGIGG